MGDKISISNDWTKIIYIGGILFVLGGIYATFQTMQKDIANLERRLDNKIKIINKQDVKIIDIEKHLEYERGLNEGNKNK